MIRWVGWLARVAWCARESGHHLVQFLQVGLFFGFFLHGSANGGLRGRRPRVPGIGYLCIVFLCISTILGPVSVSPGLMDLSLDAIIRRPDLCSKEQLKGNEGPDRGCKLFKQAMLYYWSGHATGFIPSCVCMCFWLFSSIHSFVFLRSLRSGRLLLCRGKAFGIG